MSPQPDTGEVLAGLVERVTYHNTENGLLAQSGHRIVPYDPRLNRYDDLS